MSSNVKDVLQQSICYLDTIDSTNNYAAGMIDADKAYHGLTILTNCQTQGKGQRGNIWKDRPGESVLMSVVLEPSRPIDRQFELSAIVAVSVVEVLQDILSYTDIYIKYPNDIIINDKKAAGILIENILRGSQWSHAIAGIGINVYQKAFPPELPHAGSLTSEIGLPVPLKLADIAQQIRTKLLYKMSNTSGEEVLRLYNQYLYKMGRLQLIRLDEQLSEVQILSCSADGRLKVCLPDGTSVDLVHGSFEWVWPES